MKRSAPMARTPMKRAPPKPTRAAIEAVQRERMNARFANRPKTPATADFDLPSPNDARTERVITPRCTALRVSGPHGTATSIRMHEPQPIRPQPKTAERVSHAIRESARGEECSVRIIGVCSFDATKTIWSHAPLGAAGKGRGIKSLDLCGAYCCTDCDAVVDGQRRAPAGVTRERVLLDWLLGHLRSLLILRQKGLI